MQFCICAIIYFPLYYVIVNDKCDGLRERKRRETRKELEAAAIELVVSGGLEQTTIEAISERANVSPRTFFNYFDSKEDALLGFRDVDMSAEIINDHVQNCSNDNIVVSTVSLLVNLIGPSLLDRELYASRRKIIKQYPHLLERQINRMTHVSQRLVEAIQGMARSGGDMVIDEGEAEIVLALCSSSVRLAIREWVATGKKVSLPELERQAIKIINEVTRKI